MKLSRHSRWYAAAIAMISMLFMQLAVAAYACPQLGMQAGTGAAMKMAGHTKSCCETPDPAQPSLCHAHGQVGKQSLDKPELPPVQPFVATGLAIPLVPLAFDENPGTAPADGASLLRTTAPPLAIRHCCFRI